MPTDEHRTAANALDAVELLRASLPTDLVSAHWMPIYVEPIQFSGERITVCVAIVPDGQGAPVVTTTLAPNTVEKVLGAAGGYLVDLAGRIESDLYTHFLIGGDLRDWRPHYAGVYAGRVSYGDGTNLLSLLASAMQCTSIFSIGLEPARARSSDGGLELFRHQIKSAVLAERKWIGDRFDRQTTIFGGKSKALFDYVGSDLAINFGKLDIGISSHSQQRDRLLHRLHQLLALREDEKQIAHKVNNLMLGVWTPARHLTTKEEDTFGAYTTELEFAANRSGVTYILANEGAEGGEITSPFVSRILADA